MCSNERNTITSTSTNGNTASTPLFPYPLAALKHLNEASNPVVPAVPMAAPTATVPASNLLPLDYRLQLYNYAMAERLRYSQHLAQYPTQIPTLCPGYPPYGPRFAFTFFHPRTLEPEVPKPQHSYIGLIAMAILSSPENKLVLSDIYQYILDNYPYFRTRGPGWRNSIRHNLSLNDCFIKAGRSANGKGHYWAVHPANVEDFKKGDFRRRKAQRKVRKHMGLAVDEDGGDSPSPPPQPVSPPSVLPAVPGMCWPPNPVTATSLFQPLPCNITRKRQFDVASLLAPDEDEELSLRKLPRRFHPLMESQSYLSSGDEDIPEEDIDVVTSDQDADNTKETSTTTPERSESCHTETSSPQDRLQTPIIPMFGNWTQLGSPQTLVPHPALALQQSVMFPGTNFTAVEQQIMTRYYEQLALQQQHRRLLQQHQQQQQEQTGGNSTNSSHSVNNLGDLSDS